MCFQDPLVISRWVETLTRIDVRERVYNVAYWMSDLSAMLGLNWAFTVDRSGIV